MGQARARLLGPFRLSVGGRPIENWERPSARRVLQFLLLDPRRAVTRDELVNALFPALDAEAGANALAKAISMARASAGSDFVESGRSFVRLTQPVETDLHDAIAQLEDALQGRSSNRVGALEAALAIEGEPIPEERYADWPEPVRTRLADLRRLCRFELAQATTAERTWAEAASIWESVLSADPTNEQAALSAIQAYAEGGARLQAAGVYERCRLALLEELGVVPSERLEGEYRKAVFAVASGAAESAAWLRAGREKLLAKNWAAAESAFARALEVASDVETKAAAWSELASVPYQHGDMAAVIDICHTALDATPGGAGTARARLMAQLGWAEVRSGRPEHGRPHLEWAADALRDGQVDDPGLRARVLDRLAIAHSDCGDNAAGLAAMDEAFHAPPPGLPHLHAILRMHRGKLLARAGRPEEGLGDISAAKQVFISARDDYATSVAHWMAAEILDQLGLPERALLERTAEIALLQEIGNPRNLAGALIHSAGLLRRLGRVRQSETAARRALDAALESGDPRLVAWAREGFGKTDLPGSLHAKQ